jgi:hypothetical protein
MIRAGRRMHRLLKDAPSGRVPTFRGHDPFLVAERDEHGPIAVVGNTSIDVSWWARWQSVFQPGARRSVRSKNRVAST